MKVLLNGEAKINTQVGGETALSSAASRGANVVVDFICQYGADVNQTLGLPRGMQLIGGFDHTVELLLRLGATTISGPEESALERQLGRLHGADVNWGSTRPMTILQTISAYGHSNLVLKLLSAGADVNGCGTAPSSALFEAPKCGYNDIVKMLLVAGAEPGFAVNAFYETALHAACEGGPEDVVETLLQAGTDFQISSRRHGTAAHLAIELGNRSIAAMLLGAGSNAESADYHIDSLIRVNARTTVGDAITPTLSRPWKIELQSEEAETMNVVQTITYQ